MPTDTLTVVVDCGNPPAVVTNAASNVTQTSARLNGNLSDTGGESCDVWFEWGTTTSYGNTTPAQVKASTGSFYADISSLLPCTSYHFRAVVSNSCDTIYGEDMPFQTLGCITGDVTRTASPDLNPQTPQIEVCPGDILTIQITPDSLGGFYAVQENWGGLIYNGVHTADNFVAPDTFVMITESPFTYQLQVPPGASNGDSFPIQGLYWTDPNNKMPTDTLTVVVDCGNPPAVSINPSTQTVAPGGTFTIDAMLDATGYSLKGCGVTVTFDDSVLTTNSGQLTGHNLLGGLDIGPSIVDGNKATYSMASSTAQADVSGSIMTIEFDVDGTAPQGTYDFTISNVELRDQNNDLISPVTLSHGTVTIGHKGDFDGNGCFELYDFVEFAGAFGSCIGDPNYNPIADFDNNGCIELFDFVEFAGVFGTCY